MLGKKNVLHFKEWRITYIYFEKYHLFHNVIFFSSNNTFFMNQEQKFKYQPGRLTLYGRNVIYFILKTQVVPRSKHSLSRLLKLVR
jgi:hypothetical protein